MVMNFSLVEAAAAPTGSGPLPRLSGSPSVLGLLIVFHQVMQWRMIIDVMKFDGAFFYIFILDAVN